MRYLMALITLFLALPSLAGAQGPVQIFPGDRIRLTAPDCQLNKQPAAFVSLENNILAATVGEDEIQCPFDALTRLDISLGQRIWHKDAVRWMKYGALAGLAGGVTIMAGSDREDHSSATDAMLVVVAGGAAGFLVGTVINAIRPGEEWLEAPLPSPRPSVFLARQGRLHLGFSIPFNY